MPKKGLPDNTFKMPTSNKNTGKVSGMRGKDKLRSHNAHAHSHKGKSINAHPHEES